jgi:hypothetical protein
MSIDDLQAQLRGALDQQLAALKQHYETAIAEARQQAAAEAQRTAELKFLQARAEMEAQIEQIASSARAETAQRVQAEAARDREARREQLTQQLTQEFEQQLIERVTLAEGEAERRALEAATLQWQGREQAIARQLDQDFQQQLEHVINSTKRSAELQREGERRRFETELNAARERAAAELTAERERLAAEIASAREAAASEVAGVRGQFGADLEAERARARQEVEALRSELQAAQQRADAALAAERQRIEQEREEERQRTRADFESELDAVRAEIESEVQTARGELQNVRGELQHTRGELQNTRSQLQDTRTELDAERERARAIPEPVVSAAGMNVDALSTAIRELDETRTLTQALDALVQQASAIAGRAAVFVIDGDRLKAWKASGIPDVDVRSVESSIRGRDLLARAIQAGTATPGSPELPAPPFARIASDHPSLAVPLMIGGRAVAVVYADAGSEDAQPGALDAVELLTRHASTIVALRTATRTLDVLRGVGAELSGNGDGSGDEQAARRFARLLVSEIKLYNEAAVRAGRQQRDLLQRLGPEIDRARRLYEERVPSSLAARNAYFQQELVQTLADGDAALLGNP